MDGISGEIAADQNGQDRMHKIRVTASECCIMYTYKLKEKAVLLTDNFSMFARS